MRTSRLLAAAASLAAALATTAAAGGRVFSDAEILGVVGAANHGEFGAAELASGKSANGAVKAFAERMKKEHGDAKQELVDAEAKAGLTPADTEFSNALTKDASDEAARLELLAGAEFDGAYIDAQVSEHAALLRAIDEDLLPSAKDGSVAALLRRLRPIVARHLDKARRVQAELERREK